MHIVILIILGLVGLLFLLNRLMGDPMEAFRKVPLTSVADVKQGEPCKVVGVVSCAPGEEPLETPFGRRRALFYQVSVEVYSPSSDNSTGHEPRVSERRGRELIRLQDESSSVLVRIGQPMVVFGEASAQAQSAVSMEQVKRFLAACGKAPTDLAADFPADAPALPDRFRIIEQVIAEGDRVVVVGRALPVSPAQPAPQDPSASRAGAPAEQAGQDDPPEELMVSSTRGRLVFLSNDAETIADFARRAVARKD